MSSPDQTRPVMGDRVHVFFREHSIPTECHGIVVKIEGDWITARATDGWTGEAGNTVRVPYWSMAVLRALGQPEATDA